MISSCIIIFGYDHGWYDLVVFSWNYPLCLRQMQTFKCLIWTHASRCRDNLYGFI